MIVVACVLVGVYVVPLFLVLAGNAVSSFMAARSSRHATRVRSGTSSSSVSPPSSPQRIVYVANDDALLEESDSPSLTTASPSNRWIHAVQPAGTYASFE